ncbi:(2Fe-2S)-binding protein [Pseudovibrio japonicus]|uniref:(2Fe-2S)-binding protein n=1 Tax=Pseudovibrio japonicus TaxID=366534 RepID=A0ABQ3EQK8_9HYPH|nr:2Fe-2S iron-sulfur cluster-binding protein [Pseudovibrio japonicus]GHB45756.1 (2Fe-2S)-binding protein [Pseudovibrio japonicus]
MVSPVTPKDLKLKVNGIERSIPTDCDTPLLYVLREDFGLKGTRFGCGTGGCGACTVIADGKAVTSCDLPASAFAGQTIETVETLATGGDHPLLTAVLKLQAAQCCYCLPGILMAAKALLDDDPSPTRERIVSALDGNLCRCGAHPRIIRAITEAAAETGGAK